MKNPRPHALILGAAASALVLSACGGTSTDADDYPSSSIEIVVPFGPGGLPDVSARSLANELESELGVSVQVVNVPGGASTIGVSEVSRAEADGYTLLFSATSAFATTPLLQEVSYTAEDFVGIAATMDVPYALVSQGGSDFQTIEDLAAADARITYTTTGNANVIHLSGATTFDAMGIDAEPVVYESSVESMQAVTSGQVDIAIVPVSDIGAQVDAGELVPLAVTSAVRSEAYPDVPTVREAGYPEGEGYTASWALLAPAGTPDSVVEVLSQATEAAIETDTYQAYLETQMSNPLELSGQEWLQEYLQDVTERAAADVERLGLTEG